MKIILIRGRPGTGKTTISNLLSKELNIPILRKDDIYDISSKFTESHQIRNKISYGSLYAIMESNLQTNCTFILESPFHQTDHFSIIKNWCKDKDVELKSILITCSDENIWAERINSRAKNPRPNQLITNFEEMKKQWSSTEAKREEGELVIDTVNPPEISIKAITTFIVK